MELSIQAALLNVSDLKQSIDFSRDVFDLEVVSEAYRVTAVMVSEKNQFTPDVWPGNAWARGAWHAFNSTPSGSLRVS